MVSYDVLVIGGGHAGTEACAMAARSGARTLLLTQNLDTIGQMSCNPAIGGIAKGTVVREVDALGGIMGRATDMSRLQFRMLNRSKGPAVWSPRAQCDRGLYRRAVRTLLERLPNLRFTQGTAARFFMEGARVTGIETTDGRRFMARAIVITAGTFLRGRIHTGLAEAVPAGRAGEAPSVEISQAIVDIGVTVERFKTGTPPRIDGRTVDLASLVRQDGEEQPFWFSFYERARHPAQLPCYLTHTTERLRAIITAHLAESAMYGGAISGRGPRYCPSIEDKIVRFPGAPRHQVFLEPEGLDTTEMYVNGLSTSLPVGVQLDYLRSVPGLELVEMTRPGYAIEYDYFPPTQLDSTLKVRNVEGLYFAGQINGTTGYEEAAGQGVVAGLNAAASALARAPISFRRNEAFLGVMVDDLVTRGVDEPYRLFTSRAEFRLMLRQDNALRRLYPRAEGLGLLSEGERCTAESRLAAEERVMTYADETAIAPETANGILESSGSAPISDPVRLSELARRPSVELDQLLSATGYRFDDGEGDWAAIELRYGGYMKREQELARKMIEMEEFGIPDSLEFSDLVSLSYEAREKLSRHRPTSLGQAGRIPGVTASDLQNLVMEVLKSRA
jgi:tRNA uridine 5-carboxymethylaminomethyl modification enzyme